MKRTASLLLLLAGCAAPAGPQERAPDLRVERLDGASVNLSTLWSTKPVLLVFMTSW